MKYRRKIQKSLVALVGVLLLAVACSESIPVNDAETLGLKANVRSIEEEVYFAGYSFDKIELGEKLYKRYYVFDKQGRFTEFTHVNVFLAQQLDSKQQTIDTVCSKAVDSTFTHHDSLKIDSIACEKPIEKIKTTESLSEPDFIRKDYNYLNDSVYVINRFDKRGYMLSYDDCRMSNGKLRIVKNYSDDDKLLSKTEYSYDTKNRLITQATYYEKTSYQTSYKYSLGRKYESHSYTAKHAVFSFNKNGQVSKQKNYTGSMLIAVLHYKYDEAGTIINLLEVDKITGKELETTYTYAYDTYGNWTERVEKRYDGNIFVTRRTLDYF